MYWRGRHAYQRPRDDQRQVAVGGQLGEALGGKGCLAVVDRGVLGSHCGRPTRHLDDVSLALRLRPKRGRVAHPVGAAASCSRTAPITFSCSGKPPSRYIECTSVPLTATSKEPSYHGTSSIAVSSWVNAFISASVNASVCGS